MTTKTYRMSEDKIAPFICPGCQKLIDTRHIETGVLYCIKCKVIWYPEPEQLVEIIKELLKEIQDLRKKIK